jgi:hypothetical protein
VTATQPESPDQGASPAGPATAHAADPLPVAVTHAQMNAAYDSGEAVPLGQSVSWLVRWCDAWWVVYEGGWLRVTDELTAEELDRAACRLAQGEAIVARDTA